MSDYELINVTLCTYRAADELKNEAKSHVLSHANIVMLFATIFELGHYGVVLEFVPLGCLEDFIYRHQVVNYANYNTELWTYAYSSASAINFTFLSNS